MALPLVLIAALALAAPETVSLKLDQEATVAGIPVACTGVGQTKSDPRWAAYPVRIDFSDAKTEYLSDGELTLSSARGEPILTVRCAGPWILFKHPAGDYRVEGRMPGTSARPRNATIKSPAKGQSRTVLQFPDL